MTRIDVSQDRPTEPDATQAGKASKINRLVEDCLRRRIAGETLPDDSILSANPDLLPELEVELRKLAVIQEAERIVRVESSPARGESGDNQNERDLAAADVPPSNSISGYEIIREIHRGGQGIVYLALQKSTKRKVAIKVMKERPFGGTADKTRFEREVQILGQLQHPNIVSIHDSGTAAGCFYFVMDYIPGQPLDDYMACGNLTIDDTLKLFNKICEAVNVAHLRGIIHRDLKPGNIRVDPSGEPHILDFGLAKVSAFDSVGESGTPAITVTGQFIGSLPWASPEQAEGQLGKIDVRTDVYSLGVILYHMLTGRFPYEVVGAIRDVLDRILKSEPARPSAIRNQINDEVETIVLKCLTKERERRYQSAGELARDIGHYLAGEPVEAKRDSAMYVLRKQLRRHCVPVIFGLVIFLILIASSIVSWTLYGVARGRLWESYLSSAHASRNSTLPGRKLKSLDSIQKAAAIRPARELRDEAIATLALMDVRMEPDRESPGSSFDNALFSPQLDKIAVHHLDSGRYSIYGWGSDRRLLDLSGAQAQRLWPCFSHSGKLVVRCNDSECQIWDIAQSVPVSSFPLELKFYSHADFRADDQQFAVGDMHGAVHIHDLSSRETRVLPAGKSSVRHVRFSPDGNMLAVCFWGHSDTLLIEVSSGQLYATFSHPSLVGGIAWSPDGSAVAAGCDDGRVYVWDVASKSTALTLSGHTGLPVSLFYCARGDLLCSYSWDGTSRFWNAHLGVHQLTLPFEIDAAAPDSAHFGYEVNGLRPRLAKGEILESDVFTTLYPSKPTRRNVCYSLATSREGSLVAAGVGDQGIQIWEILSRRMLALIPVDVHTVLFRTNPSELISSGLSNGVQRWPIHRLGGALWIGAPIQVSPSSWRCEGASLSSDGATLAVAANRRDVAIFNLRESNPLPKIVAEHPNVRYISISPDGSRAASGGDHQGPDGMVRVWDVAQGKILRSIPQTNRQGVCFNWDGSLLVHTGASSHRVWDTRTWRLRAEFAQSPAGPTAAAAFSPRSDALAIIVDERSIDLVDISKMQVIARLESPDPIGQEALTFGADGTTLFVANSQGHSIHMWNLRTLRTHLVDLGLDWDLPPFALP